MSWKIRHEGSPQAVEGLTLEQVTEGLLDGQWEPTDEVMGPGDTTWVAFENHPIFAEAAADLEAPPRKEYDDETRLDMNALIDVTLVLLIFFILTTSYAMVQKMIESPNLTGEGNAGAIRITKEDVKESMISVKVRQEGGKSLIEVEGKPVDLQDLGPAIQSFVRGKKTELLLEHDADVPHGVVVQIQDRAKGAGIDKVHILVPKEELGQ